MTVRHAPIGLVREQFRHWRIEPEAELRPLRPGRTADVWLVGHARGQHVAKLTYDAPEPIRDGLIAAGVARSAGIGTSDPMPTVDGSLLVMVDWPPETSHPLTLVRYIPGRSWRWRATPRGQSVAGAMLARLHRAWRIESLTVSSRRLTYLRDPRDDMLHAARVHDALGRALAAVGGAESVIYGDGLQFRIRRRELGLIDWGTVCTAWRLHDVALQLEEDEEIPVAESHPFIAGYLREDASLASELTFLEAHRALVAAYRARVHAWLALRHGYARDFARTEKHLAIAEQRLAQTDA